jgi:hypothetical protein
VIEEHLANYRRCAEEYRQIAEWLKELKNKQDSDAISRLGMQHILNHEAKWINERMRHDAIEVIKEVRFDINTKINGTTRFSEALEIAIKALEHDTVPFDFELYQAGLIDMPEEMIKVLNNIRAEIKQLPTNTRTNWNGCCPDIDYPEIEYVDIPKKALLDIIDKYITGGNDKE